MPIRRVLGLVLIAAAYWVLRGRIAAMQFEVNAGNSWASVLSDVAYLIPGGGALLAILGGALAAFGRGGRVLAGIGTGLVLLFMALVAGISGNLDMIQPFTIPVIVMLAATIGLIATKTE